MAEELDEPFDVRPTKLRPLARESRPLVRELRPLARDLHPLVRDAHPLVRELRMIDLRGVLSATGEAARQAATDRRLARALEATIDVLSETRSRGLPRIVRAQAEALALLRRSLQMQEEALVHVRSLDNRTGGPAPGSGGSPVPPGGGQPQPTSADSPSSAAPGR